MNHCSSSESCSIDSYDEGKPASEVMPKETKKVDCRFTMDYLFPPECLQIPNFLVFLCLVTCYYIVFTVSMTGLFQYHQFVEQDLSIISCLKAFSLSVGIVTGAIVYQEKFVIKLGIRWFMICVSTVALGTSIWQTKVNFNSSTSYFKFEMFSLFLNGFAVNFFFDFL
ncbi:unnamed protein product [Ambrosiozyma monospora]|uniref:Unnamed protein product n=1 Tax=Ambrosiozyma monospora TaxID=43982 RepID=A0ACB5U563_AMBMO|nr:unnamed protein product [Ambrosiozyma monospora]